MDKNCIVDFMLNWVSERKQIKVHLINPDENIFTSGYVDSLGMFRLIFDVETAFDVEFNQAVLFSSGATSFNAIAEAMLQSKTH